MIHYLPIPMNFDPTKHDAGTLHEYLQVHGIAVDGVAVSGIRVAVESDDDPTAILAAFSPEPTQREQLIAQLDAINLDTANTAKLREAVTILKQLVA